MAYIACQNVEDDNDPIACIDENWQGTDLCRYCWDIMEHKKALDLLRASVG
jgi:hypothetical protein